MQQWHVTDCGVHIPLSHVWFFGEMSSIASKVSYTSEKSDTDTSGDDITKYEQQHPAVVCFPTEFELYI